MIEYNSLTNVCELPNDNSLTIAKFTVVLAVGYKSSPQGFRNCQCTIDNELMNEYNSLTNVCELPNDNSLTIAKFTVVLAVGYKSSPQGFRNCQLYIVHCQLIHR